VAEKHHDVLDRFGYGEEEPLASGRQQLASGRKNVKYV